MLSLLYHLLIMLNINACVISIVIFTAAATLAHLARRPTLLEATLALQLREYCFICSLLVLQPPLLLTLCTHSL